MAFSVVLFCLCLHVYTRHNDFPFRYHIDERLKIEQVLGQSRDYSQDFNHPQLLLEGTRCAVRLFRTPRERQAIVERGRWVSAVYAAAAAVALAWVGYAGGGVMGMLFVGAAVGLCPQLLTYAHYMKEDTALVLGVAVTLVGTRAVWASNGAWRPAALALLGAGVGLATSGKYVGIVTLAVALPAATFAPPVRGRGRIVAALWVVFVGVAVMSLVNHRIFENYQHFKQGLSRETGHSVTGQKGLTMGRPNSFYVCLFDDETMPHIRVFAALYVGVALVGAARGKRLWDMFLLLFAGLYLLMLSVSALASHRYFLPVAVMTYTAGALGAAWLIQASSRRRWVRVVGAVAALGTIVSLQGRRCQDYVGQFSDDSRSRLRNWVATSLPPDAYILQDTYADLNGPAYDYYPRAGMTRPLSHRVLSHTFAPDAGPLGGLRRRGIEYVAICDLSYARFFYRQVRDAQGTAGRAEHHRRWYQTLERDHELVWSSEPRFNMNAFTNPRLKLYRLRTP